MASKAKTVPFVLGHALYMKAIHGGKTKNDWASLSAMPKQARSIHTRSPRCCAVEIFPLLTPIRQNGALPKQQRLFAILKNRSCQKRRLRAAISTMVQISLRVPSFFIAVIWTLKTIWPAHLLKETPALLFSVKNFSKSSKFLG
jgi:hypothetical protein